MSSAKPSQSTREFFEERARAGDGAFAVAHAVLSLTDAQLATTRALNKLGFADASTPLGAIENLALELKQGAERIADSASLIADAISSVDFTSADTG